MADQTLMDFFAGPVMTELAQSPTIKRAIPRFLPEALFTPSPTKPTGIQVKWKSYSGNRKSAQLVHHGSSSKEREMPGSQWNYATAIGSKEHIVVDQDMIYALKSNIPYIQQQAKNEFTKRVADFQQEFTTLRTNVIASTVARGRIDWDSSGNVLTSTSGSAGNIDFGVTSLTTASNIPNISPNVTVGDWSNPATDIPLKLRTILDGFFFGTNYTPKYALYGKDIPSFFYGNTNMSTYLSRQPMLNQQFMDTNEVPKGLLDLDWFPAHKNYNVSDSGTLAPWFASNQISIIAEPDDTWYEFFEAGTAVPTGLMAPNSNLEAMLGSLQIVNGKFGYVEMSTDPVKLKAITGDYFLPAVKNGAVVWIITVS